MALGDEIVRFNRLRWMVNKAIRTMRERGEPGKHYEGEWEVTASYEGPDEGDTMTPEHWKIVLHCYLIGPARHYSWDGKTFREALEKCEYNVTMWCREVEEDG